MQTSCENCLQKMCLLIDSVAEIWKLFIQTQNLLYNGCVLPNKIEVEIQSSKLLSTEEFSERNETTPSSMTEKELKSEGYTNIQNYSKIFIIICIPQFNNI